MKGIDIASYQNSIDFGKVKNDGIEVVYIKATEGVTYNNPIMKQQYDGAKAVGLKIGFYHYLRANNPTVEAEHFLTAIEGLEVDCKLVIDVEEALGQTIAQISSNVRQFADYLISKGKEVCIYTGENFYSDCLDNSIKNIPLWVAHYGVERPNATNYIGFQHSSSGNIDGINGLVDLDEFSIDIFIASKSEIITPLTPPTSVNPVVKDFQEATRQVGLRDDKGNLLDPDGDRGPLTSQVIAKVLVTYGTKNELVRYIQQRLITLGFSCGRVGTDADFGWNTLAAVQHFQASRGLKADGIVGPLTINELLR